MEKYKYRLEKTSKSYKKKLKFFDFDEEKIKEFEVQDFHLDEMYKKITFKLTPGRKIEVRLTDSTNDEIRMYYYFWMNTVFRKNGNQWVKSDTLWIQEAQKIFKRSINSSVSRYQTNVDTCKYIWEYYYARPSSRILANNFNWTKMIGVSQF